MGAVRLVFRRRPALRRRRPPHDPARVRAIASCCATSSTGRSSPTISASISIGPTAMDPFARAGGLRHVLRALARAQPARRAGLADGGRTLPQAHRARARGDRPPRSVERDRHLADHDPARFPAPPEFLSRRGLRARADPDAERLVPSAQRQRGGAQSLPGRRGHASRARDCRASCLPRAFSTRSFRMPQFSFDLREPQRPAGMPRRDPARLEDPSTPPRACCPREVRQRAFALYAFCRLSDDAVDLSDGAPRRDPAPDRSARPRGARTAAALRRAIARSPTRCDARRSRSPFPKRCSRASPGTPRAGPTRRSTTSTTTPPGSPARSA